MGGVPIIAVVAGAVVLGIALLVVLFKAMWKIAEPNEALIISGLGAKGENNDQLADGAAESLGFKIVTGKGTFVIPGLQTARSLSLDLYQAAIDIECVSKQAIPVQIRSVVIFKVGDDYTSIANAARRFLDQQDGMQQQVKEVLTGHLRSIVGTLDVEQIIKDREALTNATRESSATDMEKLGLIIDSLQIQEIGDPTGYIRNLGAPQAAIVQRDARIAEARADQEAAQKEAEAEALKAEAIRESSVKQSGYKADVDRAAAEAEQARPLAEAEARQKVVEQETRTAQLEAEREEKRLESTIRKPADARAYEQVTLAEAERQARIKQAEAEARETELRAAAQAQQVKLAGEAQAQATKATGTAEAEAAKAKGLADAAAIEARAKALAQESEAVIAQQIAEQYPEIVRAAAEGLSNVDKLTVMNGAAGIAEIMNQVIGQGAEGLAFAKQIAGQVTQTAAATTAAQTAATEVESEEQQA